MFDIGFGELLAIAVVALFVVGPERLPRAAAQAGRVIRELRSMATGARRELSEHLDLDPELASLDISSLDPRKAVRDVFTDPPPRSNGSAKPARARRGLAEGELAPYDEEAT